MGSKSSIRLPDGTEVVLNAGSKLTYDFSYGITSREVSLIGEGYFKVAKQKNSPFIVKTAKAHIKALGTEFNVKAYPEENEVEAILVEGTIQVNKFDLKKRRIELSDSGIILKPGQKILISDKDYSPKSKDQSQKGSPL
ncbi:MAG: FecR domain-containing protein [Bacteroidales bacterium]|nr:FecR domain-containing protein [Bacteroidales bacterium]